MGTRTSHKIQTGSVIFVHNSHRRSISCRDPLVLRLRLRLLPGISHPLDHLGKDPLSKVVLLEDLCLRVGLHHQGRDPLSVLLIVQRHRVDVLRHLLGRNAVCEDALLVVLQHPHHFLEVFLVLLDLVDHSSD